MKLDQTIVYLIIAAVVVGIYLGISLVTSLVKIISRNITPPQPYYPQTPYDQHPGGRDEGWGCFPTIFIIVIAGILLIKAANTKLVQELLNKDKEKSGGITAPIETRQNRYDIVMSADTISRRKKTVAPVVSESEQCK